MHVGRHEAVFVWADDSNGFAASQILLSDQNVFGIAAIVVKATFGSTARPGAVQSVELYCGRGRESGRFLAGRRIRRGVVVVRVSTMWTHHLEIRQKSFTSNNNKIFVQVLVWTPLNYLEFFFYTRMFNRTLTEHSNTPKSVFHLWSHRLLFNSLVLENKSLFTLKQSSE
jgi:hypothetical protein